MNVKPVASPGQIPQNGTPEHIRSARAIEAFNKGQSSYDKPATTQPAAEIVKNQTQVSPEEMSAISPTSGQTDEIVEAPEVTEDTPKVETPQETAASRQFAQIARQEKILRQKEQAFKAKEADLVAREAKLSQTPQTPAIDLKQYVSIERFKADPLAVMAETGMSYDAITEQLISQSNTPQDPRTQATISKLEAKIQAMEDAAKADKDAATQRQTAEYEHAVKQVREQAKKLAFTNPEFEMIKATNSVEDVVDLIKRTHAEEGILMSVEEASQQVEEYLIEEALKLNKVSKVQKRLQKVAPTVKASTVQTPVTEQKQQQQMKTLTNATGSTRQLSAKERAMLAFKGELK